MRSIQTITIEYDNQSGYNELTDANIACLNFARGQTFVLWVFPALSQCNAKTKLRNKKRTHTSSSPCILNVA
uniref:Uncharacterized protein n=1 Tax=Daphnia magna TaxID=35525 RepID=A0A0P5C654_9CRUS